MVATCAGKEAIAKLDCRLQSPTWRMRQLAGSAAQECFWLLCSTFQFHQSLGGFSLEEFAFAFQGVLKFIIVTTNQQEGVIEFRDGNNVPYKHFYGFHGTTDWVKTQFRTFLSSIRQIFLLEANSKLYEEEGQAWWQVALVLDETTTTAETCSPEFLLSHYKMTEGDRIKDQAEKWVQNKEAQGEANRKTKLFFQEMENAMWATTRQGNAWQAETKVNDAKTPKNDGTGYGSKANDTPNKMYQEHEGNNKNRGYPKSEPPKKPRRINCRFGHSSCKNQEKVCPFNHNVEENGWEQAIHLLESLSKWSSKGSKQAPAKPRQEIDESDL